MITQQAFFLKIFLLILVQLKKCIAQLKPKWGTEFLYTFQKAKTIINNVKNFKEYILRIILLSDGLDFHHENTIIYIENDVSIFK